MDRLTSDQALNTYENISMNYTLEGNMRHWIACALYVECRNGNVPTVAHTSRIEGNCVSLTRLLSICRISLLDFFTKMKKWADMANLNERMRQRIETIEKSFCVTAKIYEKYVQIFTSVFKEHQTTAQRRSIKAVKRRVHSKKLNKTYEEGVLKEGELDERIFLDENAQDRIGTPRHTLDSVQRELRMCQADIVVKLVEVPQLLTPLTGRSNLHNREAINRSPVSTATQCASKLQALLAGCKNAPSKELQALFSTLDPSLEASVLETVKSMGDAFCTAYAQPASDQRGGSAHMDFARKRLQLGETLFYKALENIVNIEMKQKRPNTDLAIEEQILECLSWKDDSPLWDAIEHSEQPVPMCKEPSDHCGRGCISAGQAVWQFVALPGLCVFDVAAFDADVPLSPVSVAERFQSPGSAVRRRLFAPNSTGGGASAPLQQSPRVESGATGQTRTVSITVQPLGIGGTVGLDLNGSILA
ncbi:hypothetical protein HPB52_005096 [Rhipicephalus sanguineus]|uniref:Uncharacterized protein n=1 Tax=Rhipicephalus sanguineus TaxID=34632 RepID=A0A9D4T728_RHISA|nr:hypothetical protein HPB52_005096 [Rhipicephalus sanguineus]